MSQRGGHEPAIRSYVTDDAPALVDLFRSTVRSVNLADYSDEQVQAWAPDVIDVAEWAGRMSQNRTFVAELRGDLAGFAELTSQGRVHMLFVAKDKLREGVATALLRRVEDEAIRLGLRTLTTDASVTARPTFEKNGYVAVRRQKVTVRSQTLADFHMAKSL